jgi:hypothetical protein
MPYKVKKGSGERPYKVVKPSGKVVGTSKTKEKAEASIRARYAAKSGAKMRNK